MHRMRLLTALIGLALAALPLARPASAGLIRPGAERAYPDIAGDINGSVTYTYDSANQTGLFQMTNTPYLIAGGPTPGDEFAVSANPDGIRRQVLSLVTNGSGQLVAGDAGNTYELWGQITTGGATYSGQLLTGTPTAFGSQDLGAAGIQGSDVFDVDIQVTGGQLAGFFGPSAYMRITPELQSTFEGSFTSNFSGVKATTNTRSYVSPQPFPIPEPSTLLVLAAGGFGLLAVRRLRRR